MKRIIIVTGASSGLGREFALQLSRTRIADEIWLVARRKEKLQDVANALAADSLARQAEKPNTGEFQGEPVPRVFEIDLRKEEGLSHFYNLLREEEIVIDSLVNNAGFGTYGTFTGTEIQRQLDMINLNINALTALCYAAIPYMKKGSLLINVASLAGFIPLGNFAVYGATKAFVLNFSTAIAAELADTGIFVSTLCPGPVDTEFASVASNGAREKVVDGKSPEAVVSHCLRGISGNKRITIMSMKWKIKAFLSRFVGRYWYARYSYTHEKRPSR